MRITYLGHSGFTVHTGRHLIIFDAIKDVPVSVEDHAMVFISHGHPDHCRPEWEKRCREEGMPLVAGEGVALDGRILRRGDEVRLDGVYVRAFGSTDEGVSFCVKDGETSVFHAGDFNFWSWRNEADAAWIEGARRAFEEMLSEMKDMRPDAAFFPVDPRMGIRYDEGALRFAETAKPGVLIPMHFWDHPEAAEAFAAKKMPGSTRAIALTKPGESMTI